MIPSRNRGRLSLCLLAALIATPAWAAEYRTFLDLDNNPGSGCTVTTVEGDFTGAEQILITTTTGDQVTAVERQECLGASFGPVIPVGDFATPWPVGIGTGTLGSDVIETYFPLSVAPVGNSLRLGFESDDLGGNGDALLTLTGQSVGGPIVVAFVSLLEIPTLSQLGLLLLALALAGIAVVRLRLRPRPVVPALLLGLALASAALATAAIVLDGDPSDWAGGSDASATDVVGDAAISADIYAAFAAISPDETVLFLRLDVSRDVFPPTGVDDAFTLDEDSPATVLDVLANDTDPDGGPRSVSAVTQPANGTVMIAGGGANLSYQPDPDYCNDGTPTDDFTYTLAPGGSMATVRMTVTCLDDPPTAVNDSFTVAEDDAAMVLNVLGNDLNADGGPISVASVTQPASGTVINNGTDVSYQPDPDYCNDPPGTSLDTFSYNLAPGGSMATVSVTVTCVDDPPVAVDDAATVDEDDPATAIPVLGNDTDIDGGPISITGVTQPGNGTVAITGGGTGLTYQPDPNTCNDGTPTDDFTYTLSPGGSMATVRMTVTCVDDPPVAVDDAATVDEDDPATAIPVLGNDTDVDAGPISITGVTQPGNGTVAITGGGTGLTYQPDPNTCNDGTPTDDFTYTLSPGGSMATVRMTVTCVDDPPAAVDDAATVTEDDPATAIPVLGNDTDIDGGPISITGVMQPGNGTVAITGGGTGLTYQPDPNYCNDGTPTDDFTYTLSPGGSMATVRMTVICVNDPPVAGADTYQTIGNTALVAGGATPGSLAKVVAAASVLANDSDPVEMTAVTVAGIGADVTPPFTGSTTLGGQVVMNANGSFAYLPPRGVRNRVGAMADTFTYTLADAGGATAVGMVSIEIIDELVWYVHNDPAGEPLNPVDGANAGRADDPFDTLAGAGAVHGANEMICVYRGDGTSTGLNAGITLAASGVKLHGEHFGCAFNVGLNGNAPPTVLLAATASNHPKITNGAGNAVTVDATAASLTGIEIRGVDLSGSANALDITNGGANNASVTLENAIVSGAASEGIDVNQAGTGSVTVTVSNLSTFTATGNAFDARATGSGNLNIAFTSNPGITSTGGDAIHIDGSGGTGVTLVTAFSGNSVDPSTGGDGVDINTVTFDATPGGSLDVVNAGDFAVGTSGDGVGLGGVRLSTVTGDLAFGDLDIESGLASLVVAGSGEFTGAAGFRLTATSGTLVAGAGPVVDIDPATVNLQLDSITSTGGVNGVSLRDVAGSFDANAGSITGSTGTAFEIASTLANNLNVTYSGTIANTMGRLIDVDGHPGGTLLFDGASLTDSGAGIRVNNLQGNLTVTATGTTINGSASGLVATGNTDGIVTLDDVAIANTTGTAISITDAGDQIGATFDFNNVDVTHTANNVLGMDIQGLNGGSVSFDAFSSFTATDGTGINIASNAGTSSVTFASGATVDLGTGASRISDGTAFSMAGNSAGTSVVIPDMDVFTSGQTAVLASGSGTLTAIPVSLSTVSNGRALDLSGILSQVHADSISCSHSSDCVTLNGLAPTSTTTFANLGLTCTGGTCFNASSARTVEVTGATNTISATNAVGISLASTTIGPSNVQFRSIASSGAATGINLDSTGNSGTFTVTGDGTMTAGVFNRNGSGGTISSAIGAALNNANNVTLRQVNFVNNSDHGVMSAGGSNHILSAVTIQNPTNHGWEATDLSGVNRIDHGSLVTQFNGLSQDGVRLVNTSVSFGSFTVDNTTFSSSSTGNDGFFHRALGTTSGTVVVSGSTFTGLDGDGVQVTNDGSGTTTTMITGCTFQTADSTGGDGNNGIALNIGGSGVHNFTVGGATAAEANLLDDLTRLGDNSGMINVTAAGAGSGGSRLIGLIQGNTIRNTTGRRGISVTLEASSGAHGGHTIVIDDNDIDNTARQGIAIAVTTVGANNNTGNQIDITDNRIGVNNVVAVNPSSAGNAEGIDIRTAATTSGNIGVDFVITGNEVVTNNTDETIQIDAANLSGTTTMNLEVLDNVITNNNGSGDSFEVRTIDANSSVCLDLNSGNVMADRNNGNRGYNLLRLGGTFGIDSIGGGGPFTDAAVNTFIDARNDGGASAASGGGFTTCTVP